MVQKIEYRNLPNIFLKAREILLGQFRPIITHFGLTEQQWRILRVLADAGELEQREISEMCLILGPSLTGVLSRMEDMELIERTRMAEDQRRVSVRMTRLGEKIVDTISPLITQQYHHLEQAFGQPLIAEVFSVLDRFVDADRTTIQQVELPEPRAMKKEIARMMK